MNKEIQEILEVLDDLNQIIFDSTFGEMCCNLGLGFSYSTNGFVHIVEFDGTVVWNSEDDNRFLNEEINEYEDLKVFLARVFREKSERQKIISDIIFDKVVMR